MAVLPVDGGRYGSAEMLGIFGEQRRIDYQLEVEGAAAAAQAEIGVIPGEAGADILRASRSGGVTAARIRRLEARSAHDTAALVEALSEKCAPGSRPWVHYGLTSNDLVDTSNSLQMRDALALVRSGCIRLASALADKASRYARLPAAGRTHGQHASVMPFGLKFANWAAEMVAHVERLDGVRRRALVCKTLGVVGTGSMMGAAAPRVQRLVAARLGLRPAEIATQVVPRERYAEYVFHLALAGATLEKIAVEVRNLQRTEIGEVAEAFARGQMGSSAVPVKRNPIKSERVTSMSRLLRAQISVAMENVPLWHERDLSNSANERFVLPTAPILLDDMLRSMVLVVEGLRVDEARIRANLDATGGQIFAEFVLEAMVRKGIHRMEAYRHVQRVAFAAGGRGEGEYLRALKADPAVSSALDAGELERAFDPGLHLGAAPSMISAVCRSVRRAEAAAAKGAARARG